MSTNGQPGIPVVCYADTGGPLALAEIDERLNEVGIYEEPDDTRSSEQLSSPADWSLAEQTCNYVTALIGGLPADGPKPGGGRHQWLLNQAVRLCCAWMLGCISEHDYRRAQQLLEQRLRTLRATTGQTVPRYEVHGAFKYGVDRASAKTEQQAWAELGDHEHYDDAETVDPPVDGHRNDTETTDSPAVDDVKHSGHLGMAVKLSKQFRNELRYVHGIGWHHWDGKRWAPDSDKTARRAVHAVIRRDRKIVERLELSTEEEEKRLKQIARYENASAISGILTEAAALHVFSVGVDDLDADPYLINCANGTLDLRTLQRRGHDPADLITKVTRAAYDPDAIDTTWTAFLNRVLPEEDVRDYLRRVIGVALLGRVVEHNLVILNGAGRNGKGTFYKAACFALGDYADMADPELFMDRRGTHPTADMTLLGLRLAVVSESGRGRALDEARMKRLTGGDTISARYLYQNQVTFEPSHLPLFVTNFLPKVSGDDKAVWARLRVVPFGVEIPEDEQDKHLDEKLQAEADAVLAWAVAGLGDYHARGETLDEPPGVLVATDKYRADSDDVGRFIDDDSWCLKADTLKATTSQLHAGYLRWVKQEGGDEITLKAFGQALDSKGFPMTSRDKTSRWRDGIALNPAAPKGDGDAW